MTSKELQKVIHDQLPNVLSDTQYDFLDSRISGKVRDSYVQGEYRFLVTTDRLSCFDRVVTTIPFKGQVLNQMAVAWFERVKDLVPHHLIDVPDPNVMLVHNCEVIPIEVVVRGYLAGSAWRTYARGEAVSGIALPEGLKMSEKLAEPLITPSTKAAVGDHDEPISEEALLGRNLVDKKHWEAIKEAALALFRVGEEYALRQGLLLVDTKYEFGLLKGKPMLLDEIHTLDSSRYWVQESYQESFESGAMPTMLDKEPVRRWLLEQGFSGEGEVPEFSDSFRCEIASHYIDSYAKILGEVFTPIAGNTHERIEAALKNYRTENYSAENNPKEEY